MSKSPHNDAVEVDLVCSRTVERAQRILARCHQPRYSQSGERAQ